MACPLSYPDKFHAAAKFWSASPEGTKALSQENQLLLYALHQQATVGPNTTTKPWGWNVVENTKWQGWKELGKMSAMEAMRLFVKTIDEEQPDWWTLLQQAEDAAASSGTDAGEGLPAAEPGQRPPELGADGESSPPSLERPAAAAASASAIKPLAERALLGLWTQLAVGGVKKPVPRYEQGAALMGGSIYVIGGNYAGRYLNDAWALDIASCAWTPLAIKSAELQPGADVPAIGHPLPPTAGHSVTAWHGKLYMLGGHVKGKGAPAMAVRVIDPSTSTWVNAVTQGAGPAGRGGHTTSLVGGKLWVFGGEDAGRKAQGDVWVLDLGTMSWSQPALKGKGPAPRSASCATVHADRYILIFGGGSVATCFNDLFVLDTETLEWLQPTQVGFKVTPRAGHSGVIIGDIWYIIGGGNNVKGCTDLLAADLSQLASGRQVTWHVVTSVALRDPLSSEGISLCALPGQRVMVAFGGYNGKYQNTVSIFKAPEGSAALLAGAESAASEAGPVKPAMDPVNGTSSTAAKAEAVQKSEPAASSQAPAALAPPVKAAEATMARDASSNALAPSASAPPTAAGRQAGAAAASNSGGGAGADAAVSELKLTVSELRAHLDGARKEAESAIREAASAKEGAAHELALMRKQLNTAQQALAESNKAVDEAKAGLAAEQAKVLKLEATISELQAKLTQMSELEKELERYRRQAKEAEAKAKGGGIWGYIAGGSS